MRHNLNSGSSSSSSGAQQQQECFRQLQQAYNELRGLYRAAQQARKRAERATAGLLKPRPRSASWMERLTPGEQQRARVAPGGERVSAARAQDGGDARRVAGRGPCCQKRAARRV